MSAYTRLGPGDIMGPNLGHPLDPRNDPDDYEEEDMGSTLDLDDVAAYSETARQELANLRAERDALRAALTELAAMVRGECPSLLDEDSGGNAQLAMEIDAALGKD